MGKYSSSEEQAAEETLDKISLAVSKPPTTLSESDELAADDDVEEESETTPEFHVNEQLRQEHIYQ